MVDSSDKAELQNSISNARTVITEMGAVINRINDQREKEQLQSLSKKAEILLSEANERCSKLL